VTTRTKTLVSLAVSVALLGLYALAIAVDAFAADPGDDPPPEPLLVIEGVRLFDGEGVSPRATVTVRGGVIETVDTSPSAATERPSGATVVDGAGQTLLPGFIDSHVHTFGSFPARALRFGVTTELDMFTMPSFARQMREEQSAGPVPGRADVFSAGYLATAPGGHGTQFGPPVPTLTAPDQAPGWVADRVAEGSDWIKIIVEDGSVVGREIPTLSREIVRAVIDATHEADLLAVAHVSRQDDFRFVVEAGVDGLVHVFRDTPPDPAVIALAAERGVFVVPTLTVLDTAAGGDGGARLAEDPRLAPYLAPPEIGYLTQSRTGHFDDGKPQAAVGALHAAGVPILAGSDASNPGTAHGASIHREMELLVAAGLSPTEALAAATSAPADAFRLGDRGRIAPGRKADLVLVEGDPTVDILATRTIVGIWKDGVRLERRPTRPTQGQAE
jgi:imidazolonepropionase-like amidohydrolase